MPNSGPMSKYHPFKFGPPETVTKRLTNQKSTRITSTEYRVSTFNTSHEKKSVAFHNPENMAHPCSMVSKVATG